MDPSWVTLQICELEMVQVIFVNCWKFRFVNWNDLLRTECWTAQSSLWDAVVKVCTWAYKQKTMLWKRCSNLNNDLWSEVEVLTLHLQVLSIIPAAQIRSLARTGFYLLWQHQNRKSYWWFEGCSHAKCWPMSCLIKTQVIICVWYRKCLDLPPKSARM